MKKLAITACALALSSFTLAQMTVSADARTRHHRTTAKKATSSTGGAGASSSAAGGNSASPTQPGARGSAK